MQINKLNRLTGYSVRSLELAEKFASESGGGIVGTEHILLGILKQPQCSGYKAFESINTDLSLIRSLIVNSQIHSKNSEVSYSPAAKQTILKAYQIAKSLDVKYIDTSILLSSILTQSSSRAINLLEEAKVDASKLSIDLNSTHLNLNAGLFQNFNNSQQQQSMNPIQSKKSPAFLKDLSEGSKNRDPLIGREVEVNRIMSILLRRSKNNPVLIGEPGVGKTIIVEGLSELIASGNVPDKLKNKKIMQLDVAGLVAGTKYRGEFEERIKNVINMLESNKDTILFIDEIHQIMGAGNTDGAMDIANILKPSLARGEFQVIGATTFNEFKKFIEKDSALDRRLQKVIVSEPNIEQTVKIIKGLRGNYESYHNLIISDETIEYATMLSAKYIHDRQMPDKAIDLIDESSASKKLNSKIRTNQIDDLKQKIETLEKEINELIQDAKYGEAAIKHANSIIQEEKLKSILSKQKKTSLSKADIAKTVSDQTGIPVNYLSKSERDKLKDLETDLNKSVIGQDQAIKLISDSIKRGRMGVSSEFKPIASTMFLGPTGVGKTELAKVLAYNLFGSRDNIIKVDMSEFMERHNVSRLVGSTPGYVGFEEGGQLTEKVRRNPYSVILFDEIEKAHPQALNILLQILDDGTLTDGGGRKISFRNTIIIMTSNVGSEFYGNSTQLGFSSKDKLDYSAKHKLIDNAVKERFSPEFLNRLDHIVHFNPLNKDAMKKIVKLQLEIFAGRLKEQNYILNYTSGVIDNLIELGFSKEYGARNLSREILNSIETPIANKLVEDSLFSEINISIKNSKIVIEYK